MKKEIVKTVIVMLVMVLLGGCMAVFHCGCEPQGTGVNVAIDKSNTTVNDNGDKVIVDSNSNSTVTINKDVSTPPAAE